MDRKLCPDKPPPPPPVAVEAPSSPKFTKARERILTLQHRWKFFLDDQTHSDSSRVSSSAPAASASTQSDIIFLDSDEEMAGPSNGKRGSASNGCPSRRHQLDGRFAGFGGGDERLPRNPPSRAGRQPAAATASGSRQAMQQLGNVVVIED